MKLRKVRGDVLEFPLFFCFKENVARDSPLCMHLTVTLLNKYNYLLKQPFHYRDLSYNSLTGEVPNFLSSLPSLKTL